MSKLLIRIIAVILVPCLLANPGLAAFHGMSETPGRFSMLAQASFETQALNATPVAAQRWFRSIGKGTFKVGIRVIDLLASIVPAVTKIRELNARVNSADAARQREFMGMFAKTFLMAASIGGFLGVIASKLFEMPHRYDEAVKSSFNDPALILRYTSTFVVAALILILVGQVLPLLLPENSKKMRWGRRIMAVSLGLVAFATMLVLSDPAQFNRWPKIFGPVPAGQMPNGRTRNITSLVRQGETINLSDTEKLRIRLKPDNLKQKIYLYVDMNPDLVPPIDSAKPRGIVLELEPMNGQIPLYETPGSLEGLGLQRVRITITDPEGLPLDIVGVEAVPSSKPRIPVLPQGKNVPIHSDSQRSA